jgi:hypothetical protein
VTINEVEAVTAGVKEKELDAIRDGVQRKEWDVLNCKLLV